MKQLPPMGERIRIARIRRGWSQTALASQTNLDQSIISKIEIGRLNPTVTEIARLALALGLEAKDLEDE